MGGLNKRVLAIACAEASRRPAKREPAGLRELNPVKSHAARLKGLLDQTELESIPAAAAAGRRHYSNYSAGLEGWNPAQTRLRTGEDAEKAAKRTPSNPNYRRAHTFSALACARMCRSVLHR